MRSRAPALVALTVALLAGCGGSSAKSNGEASKSAEQILTDTRLAAQSASSVHYAGTIFENGTRIDLDLRLVAGKGGKGVIRLGGQRIDIVRIGSKAYFKGSTAFYREFGGGAAAQLLNGRWLAASARTGDLASFTPLTDIKSLFGLVKPHGTLSKTSETTLAGQKVIAIRSSKSDTGTLYIATTGKPYPVELTKPSGASHGTLRFDHWNEQVTLTAPKGAIDMSKLKG
jgi:hypothetical protein